MRDLSSDEMDTLLVRNGTGVLALVDDEHPYPIPMSFGYDPDEEFLVMQLGGDESSRKLECLGTNPNAAATIYEETRDDAEWRSIVLEGTLVEVPDEHTERAYLALASNATFAPDVTVWGARIEDVDFHLYQLDVETRSGKSFNWSLADP